LKKRIAKQEELISSYTERNSEKKLHIGCGANILEGWLNTDLNDNDENIAYLDAGRKFPLTSNSFDFVYSEHLFEHLDINQQLNMLEESIRVLKPGGIVRIATPSLDFLNDLYNNPGKTPNKEYISWATSTSSYLFSVKKNIEDENKFYCYVINNFYRAWGHKLIHNQDSLCGLAIQIGYSECKRVGLNESSHRSLQKVEKHGTIIPEKFNILETMVVELKK